MNKFFLFLLIYLVIINIISAFVTLADKKRAVKNKWRISEKTLLLLALFGGAFSEYITMRKIHHKSKHKKFMIGLPLILFAQIVLIIILILKVAY